MPSTMVKKHMHCCRNPFPPPPPHTPSTTRRWRLFPAAEVAWFLAGTVFDVATHAAMCICLAAQLWVHVAAPQQLLLLQGLAVSLSG